MRCLEARRDSLRPSETPSRILPPRGIPPPAGATVGPTSDGAGPGKRQAARSSSEKREASKQASKRGGAEMSGGLKTASFTVRAFPGAVGAVWKRAAEAE